MSATTTHCIVYVIYSLVNSDANRPKYPATLSLGKEGNGKYSTLCIVLLFSVVRLCVTRDTCGIKPVPFT